MLSQAMESVTRAFYARSDLDLILDLAGVGAQSLRRAHRRASPLAVAADGAAARGAVHQHAGVARRRALARAPTASSPRWALAAAALAVALTVALFRLIGPKRTRLIAQIVAAVIGAAFVIGLQVAAILSYGTLSRFAAAAIGLAARARARCRQRRSGGRRAPCSAISARSPSLLAASLVAARRGDRAVLAPLRRPRDRRGRRRRSAAVRQRRAARGFRRALAGARAAAQGMDAAAARPLAGVADADADPLSAAAGAAAVAQLSRRRRRASCCWCRCW